MRKEIFINLNNQKGQLLLEVLIALSLAAVVIAVSANFIFLSLRSNKLSNEKNIALGLVEETLEAVQAASVESWLNLYSRTHSTTDYRPIQTSGKWDISTSGTENITLNGMVFSRGFRVFYVCRDSTTRNITGITDTSGSSETGCTTSGGQADPSTQKVTVTISWAGNSVSASQYLPGRYSNRSCNQTGWTTGADSSVYSCTTGGTVTSNYFSKCDVDTTVSTELKLAENCP